MLKQHLKAERTAWMAAADRTKALLDSAASLVAITMRKNPVGKPPLPPEKRRVLLRVTVDPQTMQQLKRRSEATGKSVGRLIDAMTESGK